LSLSVFFSLVGAIYVGQYGWISAGDVTMPAWGWLMMGLGIFFTLVIGRLGLSRSRSISWQSDISTHSPTLFEALNPFTFWAEAARLACSLGSKSFAP
jgi:hypothetical protein